jgi:hypothetical protein
MGVGILTKRMIPIPVTEPGIMFLFGTGLVSIAEIVKRVTVKSLRV